MPLDPLAGADAELQAMVKYYLGPDPVPTVAHEDTENPSPKQIAPSSYSKGAPKPAETLKKLKRNERDRQRSFAKRVRTSPSKLTDYM